MSETEVINKLFLELSQFTTATTANELRLLDVIEQIGDITLTPGNWEPRDDVTHRGIIASIKELQAQVAAMKNALNMIHNSALPDPYDERDISLTWLVSVIQNQYRAALKQEKT